MDALVFIAMMAKVKGPMVIKAYHDKFGLMPHQVELLKVLQKVERRMIRGHYEASEMEAGQLLQCGQLLADMNAEVYGHPKKTMQAKDIRPLFGPHQPKNAYQFAVQQAHKRG